METIAINELQKSHLIELITELGGLSDSFVLIGGQALPFLTINPRPTKDIDFVLDVFALQDTNPLIIDVLNKLNYKVVPESQNFQFFKEISPELKIRIEFLASEKKKRKKNFRVDIQKDIHARACTGAEIVINESYFKNIKGVLPNGTPAEVKIRIVKAHALLMLKLFAMDDRYRNLRGPDEYEHDRDEARVHSADIVNIVHKHIQKPDFTKYFWSQFDQDKVLQQRCNDIISSYYKDTNGIGLILYEEFLKSQGIPYEQADLEQALREIRFIIK
jgi:hypothetical protein